MRCLGLALKGLDKKKGYGLEKPNKIKEKPSTIEATIEANL